MTDTKPTPVGIEQLEWLTARNFVPVYHADGSIAFPHRDTYEKWLREGLVQPVPPPR
jgi:hypothetical protein